jgi:glycosyltransferase involved in cell wall biosynthesis
MKVAMLTVGDIARKTGGYLYHAHVYPVLAEQGIDVTDVVLSAADVVAQRHAQVDVDVAAYDVLMVDALARTAVAPHLAYWQRHKPVVAMVHELPSVATGVDAADEAPLLDADILIAVSADGRQRLCDRGVAAERIVVAPPGCDRLGPPPPAQPTQPPAVICVAQWIPRKGLDVLLPAWQALAHPTAVLHLYGETHADPAYTQHIELLVQTAQQHGAQVVVHGCVADAQIVQAYASATCLVLPSRFEGYGMVFAEALWAGVPVVACDVGPVAQIVADAGIVVPVDDGVALTEALHRMLNPTTQRVLHQAAMRRREALPRWRDTAQLWGDALHGAIKGHRSL